MNYFFNLIKNIDKVIVAVVVLLAVLSVLMIGSTQIDSGFFGRDVIVQIAAYILGIVAVFIILSFNYTLFSGLEKYLYILSLVLLLLVYHAGKPVSKQKVLREVWNADTEDDNRALWTLIYRLRRKLNSEVSRIEISSKRGDGYTLEQI